MDDQADTPAPAGSPVPSPRASDRDRDRTVAALNDAAASGRLTLDDHSTRLDTALAAVTMPELAGLLADLPVTRDEHGLPVTAIVARVDGRFGKVVRQIVPGAAAETHAVARFGQVVLDLRALPEDAEPVLITADSLFGQVKVLLPPGARVVDTGTARFGNRKASGAVGPRADGLIVYVQGHSRFGQLKCIPADESSAYRGGHQLGR
ncbi:MAG TPA: DUF1707 domain-containing protein [Acidimicrobiales bacterium]|nr:DUF1707 domain-containing protein [Acidimicrobiales bacterium]